DAPSPRLRTQMRAVGMAKIGIGAAAAAATLGTAGVAAGTTGVAGGAGVAAAKAAGGMSVTTKWLIGALGLLVAGGSGGLVYESARQASAPEVAPPPAVEVAQPTEAPAPAPVDPQRGAVGPAAEPPAEEVAPEPTEPTTKEPPQFATPLKPRPSAGGDLRSEVAVLQSAQKSLQSGKPAAALAALDAHEKKYGAGSLSEERAAARVFALCDLGRESEARAAAAQFVAATPNSPLAPRVARACAKKP
ncbi:MAG: hypothetical protein HOV80_33640, partial [Polyangiaceae bacterium]|nr:hypothetical protein [Polyangiaceae bacterium]